MLPHFLFFSFTACLFSWTWLWICSIFHYTLTAHEMGYMTLMRTSPIILIVFLSISLRLRRGLNPPHRVKSISMTTFSQQEVEFLQNHGNEVSDRQSASVTSWVRWTRRRGLLHLAEKAQITLLILIWWWLNTVLMHQVINCFLILLTLTYIKYYYLMCVIIA